MMQKNTFGEILFSLCNSEKMMVQKTRWSKKLYEQMFFDTVLIRNVTESFMGMQVKLNLTKSSRIDYFYRAPGRQPTGLKTASTSFL